MCEAQCKIKLGFVKLTRNHLQSLQLQLQSLQFAVVTIAEVTIAEVTVCSGYNRRGYSRLVARKGTKYCTPETLNCDLNNCELSELSELLSGCVWGLAHLVAF